MRNCKRVFLIMAGLFIGNLILIPQDIETSLCCPEICMAFEQTPAENKNNIKWGNVSDEILNRKYYDEDSSALAVVVFDIGSKYINRNQFNIESHHHVRIQIFKEEGKKYATVKIPYWYDESITGIKAQTILPDGKKIKLNRKDIRQEGEKDRWMYVTFTFPHVESNCVIEYQYSHTTDHLAIIDPWEFQNEIPTELSRISITVTKGFHYWTYLENPISGKLDPKIEEVLDSRTGDKIKVFTWEYRNLSAVTNEPFITTTSDYIVTLKFQLKNYIDPYNNLTFISSWEDIRDKVTDYYKPFLKTSGYISDLVNDITGDEINNIKRATLIYNYVRDKIGLDRYKGITNLDISNPKEIIKNKIADRIEKNLLLLSMLNAAHIDADPVLISTRSHGVLDSQNPRINSFDHLIIQMTVNRKQYYLDATEEYCPFEILPYKDNCKFGFLFNDEIAKIIQIPEPKNMSMTYAQTDALIDAQGNLKGHSVLRFEGYQNIKYRSKLDNIDDVNDIITKDIFDDIDNLTVDSLSVKVDSNTTVPVVLEVDYHVDGYATVLGDMIYFLPSLAHRMTTNPFSLEKRDFPVDYNYPQIINEEIQFILPNGYKIEPFKAVVKNNMDGQSFIRIINPDEGKINYSRRFQIDKLRYYPKEYSNLRSMYSYIINEDNTQIVLKKSE